MQNIFYLIIGFSSLSPVGKQGLKVFKVDFIVIIEINFVIIFFRITISRKERLKVFKVNVGIRVYVAGKQNRFGTAISL